MKNLKRLIDSGLSNTLIVGLICWAAFVTAMAKWPSSSWLDVSYVEVIDAKAGEPIRMNVVRSINRDFVAYWVASVRKTGDSSELVCVGHGTSNYRTGADLPKNLTLSWWTGGQCSTLEPGRYVLSTDWRIFASGIWPEKSVKFDSEPFEVRQ